MPVRSRGVLRLSLSRSLKCPGSVQSKVCCKTKQNPPFRQTQHAEEEVCHLCWYRIKEKEKLLPLQSSYTRLSRGNNRRTFFQPLHRRSGGTTTHGEVAREAVAVAKHGAKTLQPQTTQHHLGGLVFLQCVSGNLWRSLSIDNGHRSTHCFN